MPIPPIRGGAIEKVWFSLGREFAKRGHEVTHVSRTFSELPDEQWLDGVHHVRVRGFEFSSKRRVVVWRDLWYALRVLRVLPKADILVTNNPVLPLLIRTRRFGALYVHVARYPKGQMRFYRHASRIQTISRAVADAIRKEIPADGGKVCHIPYPIMRGDFTGGDSASEKTEKLVLYVGRIHPEKGLDYLVEAFGLLKGGTGWRLAIVGPWEEASGGEEKLTAGVWRSGPSHWAPRWNGWGRFSMRTSLRLGTGGRLYLSTRPSQTRERRLGWPRWKPWPLGVRSWSRASRAFGTFSRRGRTVFPLTTARQSQSPSLPRRSNPRCARGTG